MDAAFTATAQAGGLASAALPATEPASEMTPRNPGLREPDESMIGMKTRVIWTLIGKAAICLRVHGEADWFVMSGLQDAAWKPGHPATVVLWPMPADYAGSLPQVSAYQLGIGEAA